MKLTINDISIQILWTLCFFLGLIRIERSFHQLSFLHISCTVNPNQTIFCCLISFKHTQMQIFDCMLMVRSCFLLISLCLLLFLYNTYVFLPSRLFNHSQCLFYFPHGLKHVSSEIKLNLKLIVDSCSNTALRFPQNQLQMSPYPNEILVAQFQHLGFHLFELLNYQCIFDFSRANELTASSKTFLFTPSVGAVASANSTGL